MFGEDLVDLVDLFADEDEVFGFELEHEDFLVLDLEEVGFEDF